MSSEEQENSGSGPEEGEVQASPNNEAGALKSEIEELKRQNLYLRADFDNFRKQSIRERTELLKFGAEPLLREFISVLDDLERAANAPVNAENLDKYKSGISMITERFKKVLEKFGVEEVESLGQSFDPNVHEALTSEEDPQKPANSVSQVFKKAYKLHGKVIRPAQVVVNTAAQREETEKGD